MASKWTEKEERSYRRELEKLYVKKNLSIGEIAVRLNMSQAGVFDRLLRLNIKTNRIGKKGYNNVFTKIHLPQKYNATLAEFLGMMLGDGCISATQVMVTLGTKELDYVNYVSSFMNKLFKVQTRINIKKSPSKKDQYRTVYFGSVLAVRYLKKYHGLVHNKVREQVNVPAWVFSDDDFMRSFLRGFFDTDGSVYKLRFGIQIGFTNYSTPILLALQKMLKTLKYNPSNISGPRFYLTRRNDISRFFKEIKPANLKHVSRYEDILRRSDSGYSR